MIYQGVNDDTLTVRLGKSRERVSTRSQHSGLFSVPPATGIVTSREKDMVAEVLTYISHDFILWIGHVLASALAQRDASASSINVLSQWKYGRAANYCRDR